MRVTILGSAAGGGFPQWNCACQNCASARAGEMGFRARTQDSLAVAVKGGYWLVNASPDIAEQIRATPSLWPDPPRRSPILGVVLTNGDLDHVLGLFTLREWHRLTLLATPRVWEGLSRSAFLGTLDRFREQLKYVPLALGAETELPGVDGGPSGVRLRTFAAPGSTPLHLRHVYEPNPEDNIGLTLAGDTGRLCYVSATSSLEPVLTNAAEADVLLLDGTFWSEREPLEFGAPLPASQMGHVPVGGEAGSLAGLRALKRPRKIYTHINNTNPVLDETSWENTAMRAAGWELAYDGLELEV